MADGNVIHQATLEAAEGEWFRIHSNKWNVGDIVEFAEVTKQESSVNNLALDWHNPMKLDSPGEGYRFLLKNESRKDATHFFGTLTKQWRSMPDLIGFDNLNKRVTYRTDKPLPDDIN